MKKNKEIKMYLYLQQEVKVYGKSGLMFEKHKATQTAGCCYLLKAACLLQELCAYSKCAKIFITGNFTYFANVSVDHSSHGYCWSIKVLSTGFNVALLLV